MFSTTTLSQEQINQFMEEGSKKHTHAWAKAPDSYKKLDKMTSLLQEVSHNEILDIGCGHGFYARHFSQFGHVTGIDVSKSAIFDARILTPSPRATFLTSTLEDFLFSGKHFDLLIASEVLYYVKKKQTVFKHLPLLGKYLLTSNFLFAFPYPHLQGLLTEYYLRKQFTPLKRVWHRNGKTLCLLTIWKLS